MDPGQKRCAFRTVIPDKRDVLSELSSRPSRRREPGSTTINNAINKLKKKIITTLLITLALTTTGAFASFAPQAETNTKTARNSTLNYLLSLQPLPQNKTTQKITKLTSENEAFSLKVITKNKNKIVARWNIAKGNYLYRKKFHIQLTPTSQAKLGNITIPATKTVKNDPFFGHVKIFRNQVAIPIPVNEAKNGKINLLIHYQGCSDAGICYAPTTQKITANLNKPGSISIGKTIAPSLKTAVPQNKFIQIITHDNVIWAILIFFGFGLLLTFTPCVLPLIPILSGIINGQKHISTSKSFKISLAYVIPMALTYALAGVAAGFLGNTIQAALQTPLAIGITAGILILLSLSMFGLYELRIPSRLQQHVSDVSDRQKGGTYLGVGIMGVLSTLIVSTCITAPLVGVLTYIGHTGNAILGGVILFSMGLGMGVPLMIVGVTNGAFLPKAGSWMNSVKYFSGWLLIAVAIWIISRIVSNEMSMFLWGALLITSAVYLGALQFSQKNGWGKLKQGAGLLVLTYGLALTIGAFSGHTNLFKPLKSNNIAKKTSQQKQFIKVASIADLNQQLLLAKQQHKPVLLDFYASWCADCQWMAHFTFPDKRVQKLLKNYIVLQADVTNNDKNSQALEKQFSIYGPPDVILYDSNGNKIKADDTVGKIGPAALTKKLQSVLKLN